MPVDVLTVIADWGPDDPRAICEIEDLLTSRFGPADRHLDLAPPVVPQPPTMPERTVPTQPSGALTMTVADAAQVLRLDEEQTRALAILVSKASVTLTR